MKFVIYMRLCVFSNQYMSSRFLNIIYFVFDLWRPTLGSWFNGLGILWFSWILIWLYLMSIESKLTIIFSLQNSTSFKIPFLLLRNINSLENIITKYSFLKNKTIWRFCFLRSRAYQLTTEIIILCV